MTRGVSALMGAILADELTRRGVRSLSIAECETIAAAMVSRTADAAPPVRVPCNADALPQLVIPPTQNVHLLAERPADPRGKK